MIYTVPALRILHVNKLLLGRKNTTAKNGWIKTTLAYEPQVKIARDTVRWISLDVLY